MVVGLAGIWSIRIFSYWYLVSLVFARIGTWSELAESDEQNKKENKPQKVKN